MREGLMSRMVRLFRLGMLLVATLVVVACGSLESSPEVQWVQVPIADFKSVAGKWDGTMISAPRSRDDDWIRVLIREDGTYEFASYRMIGVFHGNGVLTLKDGRVTTTTERGTATCTLYSANDRRRLRAHGVNQQGLEYSADLTPAR